MVVCQQREGDWNKKKNSPFSRTYSGKIAEMGCRMRTGGRALSSLWYHFVSRLLLLEFERCSRIWSNSSEKCRKANLPVISLEFLTVSSNSGIIERVFFLCLGAPIAKQQNKFFLNNMFARTTLTEGNAPGQARASILVKREVQKAWCVHRPPCATFNLRKTYLSRAVVVDSVISNTPPQVHHTERDKNGQPKGWMKLLSEWEESHGQRLELERFLCDCLSVSLAHLNSTPC